jgi:hypothetical protein
MLNIKVLGPGCANCKRLAQLAELAIKDLKVEQPALEATVEKLTDPTTFEYYRLLSTPGLVINEKLVSSGRVPTREAIATWVREALSAN